MSMLSEIEKLMEDVGSSSAFRIINLGGQNVYIEGVKSVVYIGESEMQFQLKKHLLIISGDLLKVSYLDSSTCIITGKIRVVETR